jgi:hypothetical protein
MGMVLMSKRELNRIDVLARLDGGRLTAAAAADLMRLTSRQTRRLLKRYCEGGAASIANRRRGRPSNNRLSDVVRDHAIALVREPYHRGDLVGPSDQSQKAGLMKDRADRLAQAAKSPTRPARLGRRRCDVEVSAALAQATSEAAE